MRIRWCHAARPRGPIILWLRCADDPAARLAGLLERIPNLPREGWMCDATCPKCGGQNVPPRKEVVRLVKDERGPHYECINCSHAWAA